MLTIAILMLAVIAEFSTILTYGFYISKHDADMWLNNINDYTFNEHDHRIINDYSKWMVGSKYISTTCFSVLSKYYIQDVGIITRWSRLHRAINRRIKLLKEIELSKCN